MGRHVTEMIQDWIINASEKRWDEESEEKPEADICLVEVGGTVGDLESGDYFEAI